MTDRELLELAAKAAMIECRGWCPPGGRSDGWHGMYTGDGETGAWSQWNPLTDDGDALRLAVKLRLEVRIDDFDTLCHGFVARGAAETHADYTDSHAATRRAIVRAAAEIGRLK
jgi:hypothetical protein